MFKHIKPWVSLCNTWTEHARNRTWATKLINLNASQCNLLQLKVDRSSHGVDNRLRLLKDLLLHERAEVALHDLLDLHLKGDDLEQACQHVRLEGRSGGGDHRHRGVGGGDWARPLYPRVALVVETLLRPMVETNPNWVTITGGAVVTSGAVVTNGAGGCCPDPVAGGTFSSPDMMSRNTWNIHDEKLIVTNTTTSKCYILTLTIPTTRLQSATEYHSQG